MPFATSASEAPKEHPHTTEAFARALSGEEGELVHVPAWSSRIRVRTNAAGLRVAQGLYPYQPIDPEADLDAGFDMLREHGVGSVSMLLDPIWRPSQTELERAFDRCRVLKSAWTIDWHAERTRFRKSHRKRINRSARVCEASVVSPLDYARVGWEMHARFAEEGRVTDGMTLSPASFDALGEIDGAIAVVVLSDQEPVALSIWTRHEDVAYFLFGVSSEAGYAASASYLYHAEAIDHFSDCRFIVLGPEVGLRDTAEYAATGFKAGFCNTRLPLYACARRLAPNDA